MIEPVTVRRVRECSVAVLEHVRIEDVHVLDASFHGAHPVQDGPFEVDWSVQIKAEQQDATLDCSSLSCLSPDPPLNFVVWRRAERSGAL